MSNEGHTTAMLVNTDAVTNARVTIGTSKYHASRGSLAASSIVLVWLGTPSSELGGYHWQVWPR